MKQSLPALLVALLLFHNIAKAQDSYYPHQISLQYGVFTLFQLSNSDVEEMESYFKGKIGPVGFSYHHAKSPRFRYGATFVYESEKLVAPWPAWAENYNRFSVAFDFILFYGNRKIVRPYGKLGLGATRIKSSTPYTPEEQTILPSFMVVPIGFEFGDNICGFFEFGFGHNGIFSWGIRTKF